MYVHMHSEYQSSHAYITIPCINCPLPKNQKGRERKAGKEEEKEYGPDCWGKYGRGRDGRKATVT